MGTKMRTFLFLAFLAVSSEAFVAPTSAVSRSVLSTSSSPIMFSSSSKAAPKKKVAKKAAKKVAKKAAKKVAKKVAKKGPTAPPKPNPAQRFVTKFFSEENWAVQAVTLLTKL